MPLGFCPDIHLYMRASDVIVSKPGKQTVKESILARTPLITICFPAVMEQEKGNLEIMKNRHILLPAQKPEDIVFFIKKLQGDEIMKQDLANNLETAAMGIDPLDAADKILDYLTKATQK